jgi:hypothetical protein
MPLSAWITMAAVALVVYGGFALCVAVAVRKGARQDAAGGDEERER